MPAETNSASSTSPARASSGKAAFSARAATMLPFQPASTLRKGRIAVVTNVRDPSARRHGTASRGFLVRDALVSEAVPPVIDRAAFPAFNLLVVESDAVWSLRDDEDDATKVGRGVHGLSNLRLDVSWPKVERARSVFAGSEPPSTDALFAMLADDVLAADAELPRTGVPLEVERALSSPFVRMPAAAYGTRSSTVVVRYADGSIAFEERTWNDRGELVGTVREAW